jgi:hypothetical protein
MATTGRCLCLVPPTILARTVQFLSWAGVGLSKLSFSQSAELLVDFVIDAM